MNPYETASVSSYPSLPSTNTHSNASITNFLREVQAGFDETPFTPVDSLILSSLSYFNFDAYAYGNVRGNNFIPMIDILRFTPLKDMLSSGWLKEAEELPCFLMALARSRRYADLQVGFYANESTAIVEKQFCACTFKVGGKDGKPLAYLAFRGTDGTLAGWKEDFNLSYLPIIPSQKTATAYVSGVLSALPIDMPVYIGGHSKGGNLAEFAALTIDETSYERIYRIFNHDGPCFLEAPSPRIESNKFREKLDKTVPESSIFGMILENRDNLRVVQSKAKGFFQHIPFTWVVSGTDFVTKTELNRGAQMLDSTLDRWLRDSTPQEREILVDTIYELVTSGDAKSLADFQEKFASNMAAFMHDGHNLDEDTKEVMSQTIRTLRGAAGATLREQFDIATQRIRSTVSFRNSGNKGA